MNINYEELQALISRLTDEAIVGLILAMQDELKTRRDARNAKA